jgi:AAA domain
MLRPSAEPTPLGEIIRESPRLNGLREHAIRRTRSPRIRTFQQFLAEKFDVVAGRVEGLLPSEGLCLLLGADKTGKSLLNILLALCTAAGIPFLGKATRQCPVLLVEEEGSEEMLQARVARVANGLGLGQVDLPLHVLHRSRWRLDDEADIRVIEDFVVEHSIGLVVMASLAQLANVEDENKASGFNLVARNLLDVAASTHTLFVVAHHRRKPDPRSHGSLSVRQFFDTSRGTNALTAAMDVGLGLDRDPESSTGELLVLARDNAPGRIPLLFDADHLTFGIDERPPTSREQTDLDRLTAALREKGSLKAVEAQVLLKVSLNTAKDRLERLEADGVVEARDHPGRATIWLLRTAR